MYTQIYNIYIHAQISYRNNLFSDGNRTENKIELLIQVRISLYTVTLRALMNLEKLIPQENNYSRIF